MGCKGEAVSKPGWLPLARFISSPLFLPSACPFPCVYGVLSYRTPHPFQLSYSQKPAKQKLCPANVLCVFCSLPLPTCLACFTQYLCMLYPSLAQVPERSLLERSLIKEAATARDNKILREQTRELEQFSRNPHPDIACGKHLPPNAGTMRTELPGSDTIAMRHGSGSDGAGFAASSPAAAGSADAQYVHRGDYFQMYTTSVVPTELMSSGCSLTRPTAGCIGLEQRKYEAFVRRKAQGTLGQWELGRATLQL